MNRRLSAGQTRNQFRRLPPAKCKLPRKFAGLAHFPVFLFSLLQLIFLPLPVSAQQIVEVAPGVQLPADIPPLPGPGELDAKFFVTARNVALFHEMLLAPLALWVKEGKFLFPVVRNLDFEWKFGELFELNTDRNPGKFFIGPDLSVHASAGHEEIAGIDGGLPFGRAEVINRERDPVQKAYQILWNITYGEGAANETLYGTEISWIGAQALLRKSSGIYFDRFFFAPKEIPAELTAAPAASPVPSPAAAVPPGPPPPKAAPLQLSAPGDLLSQNVIQLLSPAVVLGFSELSARFRGPGEDLVWIHSPVIGKSRRILQSNRGDPFLGSVLSFDDFWIWGSKNNDVNARVVDEKTMLVPFASLSLYRIEAEAADVGTALDSQEKSPVLPPESVQADGNPAAVPTPAAMPDAAQNAAPVSTIRGYYKRANAVPATALWNYESRQYPQLAPWLPTTVYFVPRPVWILEITPRDPHYAGGRQVLVVDQGMMLPVYKIVYDRAGDYLKTVIGGWSLAGDKAGKERYPFLSFLLAVDRTTTRNVGVTNQFVKFFSEHDDKAAERYRRLLDISAHGKGAARAAEEAAPKPPALEEEAED